MQVNTQENERSVMRIRASYLMISLAVYASILTVANSAWAYVGPGAGITMLGALWAVIAGIFLALVGLLIWPIRALLRRRRQAAKADVKVVSRTEYDQASSDTTGAR